MSWHAGARLLVRLLISAALAWLCLANMPPAPAATHQSTQAYTYDGQHHTAAESQTTTGRGPPLAEVPSTVYDTVGQWSHGPWARPDTTPLPTTYTYNRPLTLVQGNGVDGGTDGLARADPAALSSLALGHVAAEDGTTLFRGMRSAADGSPELGSSAKTLGARPGIDIPVDEGGMVRPGTGGMSVNDSPTGMPEYRRPPSFGGSGKDLDMYCISSCDLGSGLRYVPDAGGHGFLEPA